MPQVAIDATMRYRVPAAWIWKDGEVVGTEGYDRPSEDQETKREQYPSPPRQKPVSAKKQDSDGTELAEDE